MLEIMFHVSLASYVDIPARLLSMSGDTLGP